MKKIPKVYVVLTGIGALALLVLFGRSVVYYGADTHFESTQLGCVDDVTVSADELPNVRLTIFVDGVAQPIPSSIGIIRSCTAEIHTRSEGGGIYLRPLEPTRRFTLREFLEIANLTLMREGYALTMMVNGEVNTAGEDLILKDRQHIELHYVSDLEEPMTPSFQDETDDSSVVPEAGGLELQ
jgi:hypothetical protein